MQGQDIDIHVVNRPRQSKGEDSKGRNSQGKSHSSLFSEQRGKLFRRKEETEGAWPNWTRP